MKKYLQIKYPQIKCIVPFYNPTSNASAPKQKKSCKLLRLNTVLSYQVHMYKVGKAEKRRR